MVGLGQRGASADEANHQDASERRDAAHRLVEDVAADRVEHDVGAATAGEPLAAVTKSSGAGSMV